jgi:hypothetical protein
MRPPKIPPGAAIIRTYAELDRLVAAFFDGRYQLLIIIGGPGVAKSTNFEMRLDSQSHLIKDGPRRCKRTWIATGIAISI